MEGEDALVQTSFLSGRSVAFRISPPWVETPAQPFTLPNNLCLKVPVFEPQVLLL